MAYTFSTVTASNGVKLYSIKTSPKNITIKSIGASSVVGQTAYGVNGGYFYDGTLLQIAVNNNIPVAPNGSENAKYARGTLVWDDKNGEFSVQVVRKTDEILVANKSNYWAQGGISMMLKSSESAWKTQAAAENIQNPDGAANRTALVYNNTNNIWLIVTDSKPTTAAFRTAIKEKIGSGTLVDGIFLDGSGSSQYKAAEGSYGGSDATPRLVYQMVALKS
ncbi:phosphodiester glycosidase family protein [Paenibacillus chitinolyticus]|uniref:phosphodiester glycosidase family protein n=1 Tax=Paenibacillus chitinolyticus TaxID=79263 RepID=UPI001C453843|nr:phosphodiester glycosidase family protein [Paenibacillus chitinolyticus]MBV6716897.1 phosphodiester glycosidase family protein [Paenibacillus chitinolyticus]